MPLFTLTTNYPGICDKLEFRARLIANGKSMDVVAFWDTGATDSNISERAVKYLDLVPNGKIPAAGALGSGEVFTYEVTAELAPNFTLKLPHAPATKIHETERDLLVGMDLICLGDFQVLNSDGRTVVKFELEAN